MKNILSVLALSVALLGLTFSTTAHADKYADKYAKTIADFKKAPEVQSFFNDAYGYAVYPTVGKGGVGIGAAYGSGRVYRGGSHTGDSTLSQLSIGFQLGGQAYSELIFFKNKAAYDDFTSGTFEFSAQASAVAITVGANAQVGSTGNSAAAGNAGNRTAAKASYMNGMAIFTAAKGGFMYEAAIAGQAFSFDAK
ncbi:MULTISPECIES: YSC84-related protein [Shewanella]|uniref:lipid-binding SYLF domain-containing protein n=1 Tax=Shewanella TaxID=22 RepID=UPI00177CB23A|nr:MULTISPECIES: lipid-binding SYLF domain-containing protein [Shewanella]